MSVFKKARNLFVHAHWNIGIVRAPIQDFLVQEKKPEVIWLNDSDKSGFISDPFGIERNGQLFLFFEFLDYKTWKGEIRCKVFDMNNLKELEQQTVFNLDCHLSYPFLLEHNGEVYCIPEMAGSGQVCLYRASRFPFEWKKEIVLLEDFPGIDNTLFQHDGLWWMFSSHLQDLPKEKVFLWYAKDLEGPWKPHKNYPLKRNIKSARPGGSIFKHENQIYRPTQDCSIRYGEAMTINRITTLNPEEFEEEVARVIHPYNNTIYNQALHTLADVSPNCTLVDGRTEMFLWSAFKGKLKKRL